MDLFFLTTNLPVADPSFVIDDGIASHSVVDISDAFVSVLQWLVNAFRQVVTLFDSIIIYNNDQTGSAVTLLDFHLAVSVFGILFAVLFVTVRSSVGNSISSVDRSKRSSARRSDGE